MIVGRGDIMGIFFDEVLVGLEVDNTGEVVGRDVALIDGESVASKDGEVVGEVVGEALCGSSVASRIVFD